jgi:uncharacterized protein (TIGR02646 family)
MHRLNRASVARPSGLTPTTPPRRYNGLRGHEKDEVRTALLTIQGQRCAYCERRTGVANDDGHIEHFRQRAGHGHLETDWENLFWSCNDEKTCGKHKDKCDLPTSPGPQRIFNHADIIKPCADDPEHFLMFVSDGTINARAGLSQPELHRYNETIRVFQLADSAFLRKSRRDAVQPYFGALDTLRAAGQELFRQYIEGELGRLDSTPFATAIRHFLMSNI